MRHAISRRLWPPALLWLALVASCSNSGPAARTYYESLDLSSPIAAVEEFVESFAEDDFMTVWLILHRDAQADFMAAFSFRDFRRVVDADGFDDFDEAWLDEVNLDTAESFDTWYLFDRLLLLADSNDALHFDFTGQENFQTVKPTEFSLEAADGTAVVITTARTQERWHVSNLQYTDSAGNLVYWLGEPDTE